VESRRSAVDNTVEARRGLPWQRVAANLSLFSQHPFDPTGDLSVPEIKSRARSATFSFDTPEWARISDR
jgi:hypothetical protein